MQRGRSRVAWTLSVLLGLFLSPASAQAHASFQGMGSFVSGLVHPLMSPTHVLIIIGLGFLAGRRVPLSLKMPMAVFVPFSAGALLLSTTGWFKTFPSPILSIVALGIAAFLALGKTPPPLVFGTLFAVAAIAMGLDSAVESGFAGSVWTTLLGTWISLSVLIFDLAYYISIGVQSNWMKIALRIAGAWIVAISLLVLAFSLKT